MAYFTSLFPANTNYGIQQPQPPAPAAPSAGLGKGYTPTERDKSGGNFAQRWGGSSVPTDASGRPLMADFISVGDANSGLLQQPYISTDFANTQSLSQLRNEAMRPEGQMSKWGQMALSQAQNQNAASNAGQTQQAQNQLAMQGGLRTGARERLASQGMQQQMRGNQSALGNIQMQDESRRQQLLQQMPGAELQQAQYQSGVQNQNIGRALQEINMGRGLQTNQYNEAMRAWAAAKTGQAAPSGGKK